MYKRIYIGFLSVIFVLSMLFFSGCQSENQPKEMMSGAWNPDDSQPWNFTPICPNLNSDSNQYDFEITLTSSIYSEVPDAIAYTLINKTGESFSTCGEFIEKAYDNGFPPYYDEVSPAWVRVPFYRTPIWGFCPNSRVEAKVEISKYTKENYKFTPGKYRILFFLNDGPHYAYFEITG